MEKEQLKKEKDRLSLIFRNERERQGMTKYKLSQLAGTQITVITRMEESSDYEYSIDTLIKVAEALGLKIIDQVH